MYHALSPDRSDLKEMKREIQTVREKLNEGTDFITTLEIVILLLRERTLLQKEEN